MFCDFYHNFKNWGKKKGWLHIREAYFKQLMAENLSMQTYVIPNRGILASWPKSTYYFTENMATSYLKKEQYYTVTILLLSRQEYWSG